MMLAEIDNDQIDFEVPPDCLVRDGPIDTTFFGHCQ
jgi:hypothetical protein